MTKISVRGFTLIELLVVIAIIGLLSTIVVASLSSVRGKARDTARIASLQEMSKAIAIVDTDPGTTFVGCTAGTLVDISTCTVPDFVKYKDPSSSTACGTGVALTAACQYAIGNTTLANGTVPTSQNYMIKTVIENASGNLTAGVICISSASSGNIVQGAAICK